MDIGSIVVAIVVGGIAGWLADKAVKGISLGLIWTIVVGVIGGVIGGWLFGLLGVSLGLGIVGTIITAFVGAVILLLVVRAVARR